MKISMAALGSLILAAVVLLSIFVIVPAITDDDDGDSATITLPGVSITTVSTDEDGSAFFDGEDGEEIEVLVHRADGTTWDAAIVHYVDGDGYELFVAEDPLGRFLPSWAFFDHTSLLELTTRGEGLVEVVPDTGQFNAIVSWIEDVNAGADARRCVTGQELVDEANTRVALTTATLSPFSSVAVGSGTARNSIRFLEDIVPREPSEVLFDVFEFHVEGITTTIRHYDTRSREDCRPEPTVGDTPVPSDTPQSGQPTPTPLPDGPAGTPEPDQPTETPGPDQPTDTPGPGQLTDTPGPQPTDTPRPQPTDTPRPAPTNTPVEEEFMRITAVDPPLGTTITANAIISVTVEFRVSSIAGVSLSGLADLDVNLLSLGIHSLATTQGTLTLQGQQFSFSPGARLCAVSVTMERLTPGGGEQLASDSRGYSAPVC